jgi:hypothetical protein
VNVQDAQWNCASEDEMHWFVEEALTIPLTRLFQNALRRTRNNQVETSAGRADYSLSKDQKQVFRGEDKHHSQVQQHNPRQELKDKTVCEEDWVRLYGDDVKYTFGYFCIGYPNRIDLQFVVITNEAVVLSLGKVFNILSDSGMLACRFFITSLFPKMIAVADAIKSEINMGWTLVRENNATSAWTGCSLSIGVSEGRACLVKDWTFQTNNRKNAHHTLMTSLKALLPVTPYLMTIVTVDIDDVTVRAKFLPFGCPTDCSFRNAKELCLCLSQIVCALQFLFTANLVHNDLRWPNVVKNVGSNYVLVDYDLMAVMGDGGKVGGVRGLDSDGHHPNIEDAHGFEVDIWGFGHMLVTCKAVEMDGIDKLRVYGETLKSVSEVSEATYQSILAELVKLAE